MEPGDAVDQKNSSRTPVEGLDNRPEWLLTGSIPNLQLNGGILIYVHHLRIKLDSQSCVVGLFEFAPGESVQ